MCCHHQCSPPFVGDGERCTLDSDGDGYPDVALTDSPVCSDPEGTQELFCTQVLELCVLSKLHHDCLYGYCICGSKFVTHSSKSSISQIQ